MTATTFTTQRQLMRKNMPESALTGQYAQQQKILLYVLPVVFAVGGIAFPIGVLLYWTTSNLWTMGQQFYVIRNNPTPARRRSRRRRSATRAKATEARRGARRSRPAVAADARGAARRHRVHNPRSRATQQRKKPPARARPQTARQKPHDRRDRRRRRPSVRGRPPTRSRTSRGHRVRRPDAPSEPRQTPIDACDGRADTTAPTTGRRDSPGQAARSARATSPPTTSRSCSTSPTSTATWTWTSKVTAPPSRSSGPTCSRWSAQDGQVLEALQELTRLAVYRETGERSRLMLDIGGYRADAAQECRAGRGGDRGRQGDGEPVKLSPMTPFERKVVHDAVAAGRPAQRVRGRRADPVRRRAARLTDARGMGSPEEGAARSPAGPGGVGVALR